MLQEKNSEVTQFGETHAFLREVILFNTIVPLSCSSLFQADGLYALFAKIVDTWNFKSWTSQNHKLQAREERWPKKDSYRKKHVNSIPPSSVNLKHSFSLYFMLYSEGHEASFVVRFSNCATIYGTRWETFIKSISAMENLDTDWVVEKKRNLIIHKMSYRFWWNITLH